MFSISEKEGCRWSVSCSQNDEEGTPTHCLQMCSLVSAINEIGRLSSRRVPVHSWFVHRASHRLRLCPPAVFASTSANAVRMLAVFHVSHPLVGGMLYCGAPIRVVQWAPAMQVWLCLWIVSEEDSNLCMYPRTMS